MAGANPPELKYGDATDTAYQAHRQVFIRFLETAGEDGEQATRVRDMVRSGSTRFALNLDDMRVWVDGDTVGRAVVDAFLQKPLERLAAWEDGLRAYIHARPDIDTGGAGKYVGAALAQFESRAYHIAVDGNLGVHRLTPYTLTAAHISQMVAIDGIATKLSLVRPKVVRSVHYNAALGTYQDARYHDATSITGFVTSSAYPTKDKDGNPLTTEFGLSTYEDHQTLVIQEMPERTQPGQMPRSVAAILDGDLVDRCKPGDRVRVTGVYRALAGQSQGETTGNFRTALIVNNVKQLTMTTRSSRITEEDVKNIRQIAKRKDAFELLSRSIAPSIEGHPYVKKAMLLLLLGGVEKNLDNGSHIRGDINLLMIGDPSTAKSQLLRFLLHLAPLAINTTGRGSTGVGLTAAVHTSAETNDRVLEAGAMVLADRGIVCIDEFDKMSVADRVAIHEVMEQQTVTIAKAGIHMSLNARCSVVAAANPVYGQYDSSKGAADNIGLPDSILSRFDAVFVILDEADKVKDMAISGRVLANHRYYNPKLDADDSDDDGPSGGGDGGDGKDDKTEVFEKFDKMLHSAMAAGAAGAGAGGRGAGRRSGGAKAATELVTIGFLKKFIEFSKSNGSKVVLTPAAVDFIVREYTALRARKLEENLQLPITARTLETMIRLSTAHAKLRQSATVDERDCNAALEIMKFAIENNTKPKAQADDDDTDDKDYKPRPKRGGGGGADGKKKPDADDDDDDDAAGGGDKNRAAKRAPASPKRAAAAAADPKKSPRRAAAAAGEAKRVKAEADADAEEGGSQAAVRAGGKRKKAAAAEGKSKAADADGDDDGAQVAAAPATPTPAPDAAEEQGSPKRQRTGRRAAAPAAAAAAAADEPAAVEASASSAAAAAAAPAKEAEAGDAAGAEEAKPAAMLVYVDPARLEAYQTALGEHFGQTRKAFVPAAKFLALLNARNKENPFDADESDAILEQLQAQGKVMYSKDVGDIHRAV